MGADRDPETDQQLPIVNDNPSCQDMVIADIEARKALGIHKYGTLLQPHNGRSFLQDAYEEVLDLAVYLRGKLYEERGEGKCETCNGRGEISTDGGFREESCSDCKGNGKEGD